MLTDSSFLKKIKTAQIAITCQGISASSFSNVITLANKQITLNHYFNNHINKEIHEYINKQIHENNSGKIYLWWNLPWYNLLVTPETPRITSQICTTLLPILTQYYILKKVPKPFSL